MRRVVALEGDVLLDRQAQWVGVPRGHCWIENDNAEAPNQRDSNDYGPVRLGLGGGCAKRTWTVA